MPRRKTIPLRPDESALLRALYVEFNIPTDQFRSRQREAARFCAAWNDRSERNDDWGDVLHYMVSKRKQRLWPALGSAHRKLACPDWDTLTAAEWRYLEQIYRDRLLKVDLCSDALAFDQALASAVARCFCGQTGRSVPSAELAALIYSKRKRGEWVKQGKRAAKGAASGGDAWCDLDEVA